MTMQNAAQTPVSPTEKTPSEQPNKAQPSVTNPAGAPAEKTGIAK